VPDNELIRAAYRECRRLAKHYENFPVASRLVPAEKRDALAAIYAFARAADDFADEPGWPQETRLAALEDWSARLERCYAEPLQAVAQAAYRARVASPAAEASVSAGLIFAALGDAARQFRLSKEHFQKLLQAFKFDVTTNRHATFDSLLEYCTCSANPVGRLVLELFGYHDPGLFALSDHICTGLQLANFWQDVAIDLDRDRVYLPIEDLARFGLTLDEDVRTLMSVARFSDPSLELAVRWKQFMTFEIERTRRIFESGLLLPELVETRLRRLLRLIWVCGMTILDRIEAVDGNVFEHRPKLRFHDFIRLWFRARRPLSTFTHEACANKAVNRVN
jgi:phytoene synthase